CAFFIIGYLRNRGHLGVMIVLVGLFGSTAFGLFRRRDWALPASVTMHTLLVAITAAEAADRDSSRVAVGASVFSLPWLLAVYLWVRDRLRRKREREELREEKQPDEAADPDVTTTGWTKEWGGGRVKFVGIVAFGLLSLAVGIDLVADGEPGNGIVIGAFGAALVSGAAMFRTWHRDGRVISSRVAERGGEVGLLFPYSRSKSIAGAVASVGMSVTCGSLGYMALVRSERDLALGIFGVFGSLFFGFVGIQWIRSNGMRGGYIALLEGGIFARIGVAQSFVPWDVITSVEETEITTYYRGIANNEPFVGLMISDLDRVEMGRVPRGLARANRLLAADINYPVRTLDVDPIRLLHAIRHYWQEPEARERLRTGEASGAVPAGD
ncbi:MAG: hypothetical protein M3198_19490, partial [Actinomycetota bacterium]|nr:hypothetical protein [Actinomycetota bacterium]